MTRFFIPLLCLLLPLTACAAPTFTLLEGNSGEHGRPTGISMDGTIVVGNTTRFPNDSVQPVPILWTNGTREILDAGGATANHAAGISADGSMVVGSIYGHYDYNPSNPNYPNDFGQTPVYWTHGASQVNTEIPLANLGNNPLAGPFLNSPVSGPGSVNAVSADGSTLVGTYVGSSTVTNTQGNTTAAVWVNGGYTNLGAPPGQNSSFATAVSSNGSVAVGGSYHLTSGGSGPATAVMWTNGVASSLGTLPGISSSQATGVSGDGSVVIGTSGSKAFRWTAAGMQELLSGEPLNIVSLVRPDVISSDGLLIGGSWQDTAGGLHAEFWWNGKGYQMDSYVFSLGLNVPQGFVFDEITAVSGSLADGYNIAGYGFNPATSSSFGDAFLITGFTPPTALPESSLGWVGIAAMMGVFVAHRGLSLRRRPTF